MRASLGTATCCLVLLFHAVSCCFKLFCVQKRRPLDTIAARLHVQPSSLRGMRDKEECGELVVASQNFPKSAL